MVVIVTVAFIYFAYFSDSFAPVREERERPSVDRSGRFYEESEARNDESYNIIDDVQTENENSTDSWISEKKNFEYCLEWTKILLSVEK